MTQPQELPTPDAIGGAERQTAPATADRTVQFVVELAEALTRAGAPEGLVQPRAARIAQVYGVPDARVVVLPNFTLAAEGRGAPVALDSTAPSEAELRLDQMAAVEHVARLADRGAVRPEEGLRELEEARALRTPIRPGWDRRRSRGDHAGTVPDPAADPVRAARLSDLRRIGRSDEAAGAAAPRRYGCCCRSLPRRSSA